MTRGGPPRWANTTIGTNRQARTARRMVAGVRVTRPYRDDRRARKLPRARSVRDVPSSCQRLALRHLEDPRRSHAAADAHRHEPLASAAADQLMDQLRRELRARGA